MCVLDLCKNGFLADPDFIIYKIIILAVWDRPIISSVPYLGDYAMQHSPDSPYQTFHFCGSKIKIKLLASQKQTIFGWEATKYQKTCSVLQLLYKTANIKGFIHKTIDITIICNNYILNLTIVLVLCITLFVKLVTI